MQFLCLNILKEQIIYQIKLCTIKLAIFRIDNKYTYRLLDLSSTIHTDDSISVLGHPGNFVSNKKFLLVKAKEESSKGSLISVEDDIVDGKYDGESWEKLITAIADTIDKRYPLTKLTWTCSLGKVCLFRNVRRILHDRA